MKKYITFLLGLTFLCIFFNSCRKKEDKNNMDKSLIFEKSSVSIIKDKVSKQGYLIFNENIADWTLKISNKVILSGSSKVNDTIPIPNSTNKFEVYNFSTPNTYMYISEEHLPMNGGYNFRDLGGLETKDGKYVKWGKIIRSDDLSTLKESDLDYLSTIPLKSVIDFRSKDEIDIAPDILPSSVTLHESLSINPGNLLEFVKAGNIDSLQAINKMEELNIALVSDTSSLNQYIKFFEVIQNQKDIPLLFHCSAGKDRTGMGAALVLYALGVPEETIFKNYLESNIFLADKYKDIKTKYPSLSPFFEVKQDYLKAGFDEIKKNYGSVDSFLVNILKVDTIQLRKYFLYND